MSKALTFHYLCSLDLRSCSRSYVYALEETSDLRHWRLPYYRNKCILWMCMAFGLNLIVWAKWMENAISYPHIKLFLNNRSLFTISFHHVLEMAMDSGRCVCHRVPDTFEDIREIDPPFSLGDFRSCNWCSSQRHSTHSSKIFGRITRLEIETDAVVGFSRRLLHHISSYTLTTVLCSTT